MIILADAVLTLQQTDRHNLPQQKDDSIISSTAVQSRLAVMAIIQTAFTMTWLQ
jgi:hypothetical protein